MRSESAKSTLPHWLGQWARSHGGRIAVTYVEDDGSEQSWTYEQLWSRASLVARMLPAVDQPNPRALLLYRPGIEFLAGLLGCQIRGWIPVPTCYPKPGREMPRLDAAATDCDPAALLTDQTTRDGIDPDKLSEAAGRIPRIATDVEPASNADLFDVDALQIDSSHLALLQYTSGSTSDPKGVMISHHNLMSNLESIRCGFGIDFPRARRESELRRVLAAVLPRHGLDRWLA